MRGRPHAVRTSGLVVMLVASAAFAADWQPETTGAFRASRGTAFLPDRGVATRCLELGYPGTTVSTPGQHGAWSTAVSLPAGKVTLSFHHADGYAGPTRGHHLLQVLLDQELLWERDMAGGGPGLEKAEVELPGGEGVRRLTFRLYEQALVTNFPVRVQIADVALVAAEGRRTPLLPVEAPMNDYRPFPPDHLSPSLPIIGGWTWQAGIVQPWGPTQTVAVREAEEWSRRFVRDHGLNTIIMLPPAAHNAISSADEQITEEGFAAALAAYRREGMKVILYTAIMHKGHDPEWQLGGLARSHPEWAMRGSDGDTVVQYGNPWLCPATGALEYTLEYTAGLVRRHDADGVMLDNNEFMTTTSGRATCYCDGCRQGFRRYVLDRFGADRLRGMLGLTPEQVALPQSEDEPLWGLWLAWRNRLWGEACERYRLRLREVKPSIVVSANTQYLYSDWMLAVDGQYAHLDAFLSESRGHHGPDMAAKMVLGRALAVGRPLWNYIGTFDEGDFTKLRSAEEVAAVCSASAAFGANPWIVFYGFLGEENRASLEVIRQYTDFWRDNADLLGAGRMRGDVAVLFSTESRDLAGEALLPPVVADLLREGVAVCGRRDAAGLVAGDLEGVRVLVATHNPCLRQSTADLLAAWVRRGGRLVITSATGWRDEYGRWRQRPALNEALGANAAVAGEHRGGLGEVLCVASDEAVRAAAMRHASPRVRGEGALGVSWNMAADGRTVLAVVGFGGPVGEVTVRLPGEAREVELRTPGEAAWPLVVEGEAGRRTVTCEVAGRLGLVVSR